jgi:hypothetical protein
MRVLLKNGVLEKLQKELNMKDKQFCEHIGVSRSQLWRAKMSPDDRRFSLGQDFIAKILNAFSELMFEEVFFLDEVFHECDNVVGVKTESV